MKTIPLGKSARVALVDDDDYERLARFKWCARVTRSGCMYAQRNIRVGKKRTTRQMHHDILGEQRQTDHRDGDGLNNQKANLRWATTIQNAQNRRVRSSSRTGIKGVTRNRSLTFSAYIGVQGKILHLGNFPTLESAAAARRAAAKQHFGDFFNEAHA